MKTVLVSALLLVTSALVACTAESAPPGEPGEQKDDVVKATDGTVTTPPSAAADGPSKSATATPVTNPGSNANPAPAAADPAKEPTKDPAPVTPTPQDPAPVTPAPTDPAPAPPDPVPAPVEPAPKPDTPPPLDPTPAPTEDQMQACFDQCTAGDAKVTEILTIADECYGKCGDTDNACLTACDEKMNTACAASQASCDKLDSCATKCFPAE